MTDFLIDTNVFLWWEQRSSQLPAAVRKALAEPDNNVHVSAASLWEIATKPRIGKLEFSGPLTKALYATGFLELLIAGRDAELAGDLEWDHRAPFDRIILAQCINNALVLVTSDAQMRRRTEVAHFWPA
jgi:PIN domain nuclease of toxin-antitoxin system